MAFIGENFPGDQVDVRYYDYNVKKRACNKLIYPIFQNAPRGFDYIMYKPYQSKYGYEYGYIYACDLSDVEMPEMKLVRDFYMENAPADKNWKPLRTIETN